MRPRASALGQGRVAEVGVVLRRSEGVPQVVRLRVRGSGAGPVRKVRGNVGRVALARAGQSSSRGRLCELL